MVLESLYTWIGGYFNDFISVLIYSIFYPVICFVNGLWSFFKDIYTGIYNFAMSVWGFFNSLYNCIFGFLDGLLPSSWVTLLMLALLIIFCQVLYSYLRDIEIAGFKI